MKWIKMTNSLILLQKSPLLFYFSCKIYDQWSLLLRRNAVNTLPGHMNLSHHLHWPLFLSACERVLCGCWLFSQIPAVALGLLFHSLGVVLQHITKPPLYFKFSLSTVLNLSLVKCPKELTNNTTFWSYYSPSHLQCELHNGHVTKLTLHFVTPFSYTIAYRIQIKYKESKIR